MDGCSNICGHTSKLEWLTTEMLFLEMARTTEKSTQINNSFYYLLHDQEGVLTERNVQTGQWDYPT